jgi:putative ABC transport system permease protein
MQIASLRVPIREYFREKSDMWQDLRYAARIFWKKPGFAIAAILPLAFGVGATTALFSVVYAVLLDPLPYTEPDRIINNSFHR